MLWPVLLEKFVRCCLNMFLIALSLELEPPYPLLAMARVRAEGTYDASEDLEAIDRYIRGFTGPRELLCLYVFAGCGNFTRTCQRNYYPCKAVDVLRDPIHHDLTTKIGFFSILQLLLTVAPFLRWLRAFEI